MATITHYIYSHYDAKDRESLEIATGQIPSGQTEDDETDPWQTESSFGVRRLTTNAPRFVPAVVSYDEVNNMMGVTKHLFTPAAPEESKSEVGLWYRSLARQVPDAQSGPGSSATIPRSSTMPPDAATTSTTSPTFPASETVTKSRVRTSKNDWFIRRALHSEPASKSNSPAPTLADILAREPPASSAQQAVKPPVFLALGPTNRGWSMLQQQGWNEGEGLGATAPRQIQIRPRGVTSMVSQRSRKGKGVDRCSVKHQEHEVQLDSDGEISEVRRVEVVDLTLSDSDQEEDADDTVRGAPMPAPGILDPSVSINGVEAHSKPLLTPIPTVLKSDRLGIGLKAKTVGSYKASKKRVTHNQAALASHIKEAEELRRVKALVGRGSRGFARLAKADSDHRRQLLASLNSP